MKVFVLLCVLLAATEWNTPRLAEAKYRRIRLRSLKLRSYLQYEQEEIATLHGTYQYLQGTGQLHTLNAKRLNNTGKAEQEALVFNRIEKVGSQSMMALLNQLSFRNNFSPYVNTVNQTKIGFIRVDEVERGIAQEITDVNEPMSYTQHLNWVNFTKFGLPKPVYMNLVRHPIAKVISAYYYIRKPTVFNYYVQHNGRQMESKKWFETSFNDCVKEAKLPDCQFGADITTYNKDWRRFSLHLCGNHPDCSKFNSKAAMQRAKRNVEKEYAVVGSWEDTNVTLSVLENYIPRFFRGATKLYYSDTSGKYQMNSTPHDTYLEPEIEAMLKMQFSYEIELYNFCKQRLYKQYIAIKKEEMIMEYN